LKPVEPCVETALFQRLRLNFDGPVSIFAFNLYMRRYTEAGGAPNVEPARATGRGQAGVHHVLLQL